MTQGQNAAAYQLFDKRLELAEAYNDAGNYQQALHHAEAAHKQTVEWQDELREARAGSEVGILLQAIGKLQAARTYLKRALTYLERVLAIREQVLSPIRPDTATSLNSLGVLLQTMGALQAARSTMSVLSILPKLR